MPSTKIIAINMVTMTLKGIKRETMEAMGQEQDGQGKEVCVENEEMQRAKYQGSTITYYKKRGTLCIQGKEAIVTKIGDQLMKEDEKEERVDMTEQGTESGKSKGKAEQKEQNKEWVIEEEGGSSIIKKLEKIRDGINEEMNKQIKELEGMLAETGEKKKKENPEMQQEEDKAEETKIPWTSNPFAANLNPVTETRKREREEDDITDGGISLDLNTI